MKLSLATIALLLLSVAASPIPNANYLSARDAATDPMKPPVRKASYSYGRAKVRSAEAEANPLIPARKASYRYGKVRQRNVEAEPIKPIRFTRYGTSNPEPPRSKERSAGAEAVPLISVRKASYKYSKVKEQNTAAEADPTKPIKTPSWQDKGRRSENEMTQVSG